MPDTRLDEGDDPPVDPPAAEDVADLSGHHLPEPVADSCDPGSPALDSPSPCADGTCSPASPSTCPVAAIGGGHYTPPAALARVVRRRWGRCAHPGCRRRATACDLDHVTPFRRGGPAAGRGTTCACNLEPKCRRHHLLKHGGRQDLTDPDDGWVPWTARWRQWRCDHGSSHWRSPLGVDHHTAPRPSALPEERYRPTPWPPRDPDEERRLGRRHARSATPAMPAGAATAVVGTLCTFPDEPPF